MLNLLPGAILDLQRPNHAGDSPISPLARFEQAVDDAGGISERPLQIRELFATGVQNHQNVSSMFYDSINQIGGHFLTQDLRFIQMLKLMSHFCAHACKQGIDLAGKNEETGSRFGIESAGLNSKLSDSEGQQRPNALQVFLMNNGVFHRSFHLFEDREYVFVLFIAGKDQFLGFLKQQREKYKGRILLFARYSGENGIVLNPD